MNFGDALNFLDAGALEIKISFWQYAQVARYVTECKQLASETLTSTGEMILMQQKMYKSTQSNAGYKP